MKDKLNTIYCKNIKISVIIPFFNRIEWTIQAVKSVINQTYKNLEVILIDDGSTDDLSPLKKIIKRDKRIFYFRNNTNTGVSFSRNRGIKKATGEYIAFLDSDDLFLPNKIEKQLFFMISKKCSFSHTSYKTFGMNRSMCVSSGKITYVYPEVIDGCSIATPTVMVKKKLIDALIEPFPVVYKIGEDICLWVLLSKKNSLVGLNERLTMVRKFPGSTADDRYKQMIGIKNVSDFVFSNSLDNKSVISLKKLNDLLFYHAYKVFNIKNTDVCEITKPSKNKFKKIKDYIIISFYKVDKLVPKAIRKKVKKKISRFKFVRKYLIK